MRYNPYRLHVIPGSGNSQAALQIGVCPNFLAALNGGGGSIWPEFLPLATTIQHIEGRDGHRVGAVPAASMAFQPLRAELALGFRRPAANLPALRPEGRVVTAVSVRVAIRSCISSGCV
jgi:hypothetical protein